MHQRFAHVKTVNSAQCRLVGLMNGKSWGMQYFLLLKLVAHANLGHIAPKTALKDMLLTLCHIFSTIQKLVPFFSVGSPTFKNTLRQPLR